MAEKMMNSIGVFEPLQDNVDDDHRIPPSPVVHVRGLGEAVVEADLVEALNKFGNIWYKPHTFRATTCTLTFCTRSFEMENAYCKGKDRCCLYLPVSRWRTQPCHSISQVTRYFCLIKWIR